jgi:hypothetical protein
MTLKHQAFMLKYLELSNATAAYKEVYGNVTDSTAQSNSAKLLKRPDMKAAIDEERQKLQQRGIWACEDIIRDLKEIAEDRANTKASRLKAYHLGMSCLGMARQNVNVTGRIESTMSHIAEEDLDKILEDGIDD